MPISRSVFAVALLCAACTHRPTPVGEAPEESGKKGQYGTDQTIPIIKKEQVAIAGGKIKLQTSDKATQAAKKRINKDLERVADLVKMTRSKKDQEAFSGIQRKKDWYGLRDYLHPWKINPFAIRVRHKHILQCLCKFFNSLKATSKQDFNVMCQVYNHLPKASAQSSEERVVAARLIFLQQLSTIIDSEKKTTILRGMKFALKNQKTLPFKDEHVSYSTFRTFCQLVADCLAKVAL